MDRYEITFSDIQVLERLRFQLDDASTRLGACLDTASQFKIHCHQFLKEAAVMDCDTEETISAIDAYIVQITLCRRGLEAIMKTLEGTYNLVGSCLFNPWTYCTSEWRKLTKCICPSDLQNHRVSQHRKATQY